MFVRIRLIPLPADVLSLELANPAPFGVDTRVTNLTRYYR